MSTSTSHSDDTSIERQPAKRVFALELQDATETFTESDDERAPKYTILPTGERANRVFIAGTLTDTENVGNDSDYYRAKINGPTGTFYVYAGQYQPDAAAMLRSLESPAFVSVVGKIKQFTTDEGDLYAYVSPESVNEVEASTRDHWVGDTAARTYERIRGFDTDTKDGQRALDAYGDDLSSYTQAADDAIDGLSEMVDSDD